MKIYVYAIAKNEINNVDRFVAFLKDADGIYVADTGSTDGTQERLRELGVVVQDIVVEPFRFDEAKNKALDMVPDDADLCVNMDLDEFFAVKEWRQEIEKVWNTFEGKVHKIVHTNKYMENLIQNVDNIHSRFDYVWKNRCHEHIEYKHQVSQENPEYIVNFLGLEKIHEKNLYKDRSYYFDLIEQDYLENPKDPFIMFNYGREMVYREDYEKCIEIFDEYVKLFIFDNNKTDLLNFALRIMAHCHFQKEEYKKALQYSLMATGIINTRESWLQMAEIAHKMRNWNMAQMAIVECLKEENPGVEHSNRTYKSDPYLILIDSLFNMGVYDECIKIISEISSKFSNEENIVKILANYYEVCFHNLKVKQQGQY